MSIQDGGEMMMHCSSHVIRGDLEILARSCESRHPGNEPYGGPDDRIDLRNRQSPRNSIHYILFQVQEGLARYVHNRKCKISADRSSSED